MPWCPNCKEEYRDEFNVCSDCGAALVEQLEPEAIKEEIEETEESFLIAVDEIEADVIESLLASCDIPVRRKYKEAGAFLNVYMGNTVYGVDLFVPASELERAKEIVESKQVDNPQEFIEADNELKEDKENEEEYYKKRRISTWMFILMFMVPGIPLLCILILYLIDIAVKLFNF